MVALTQDRTLKKRNPTIHIINPFSDIAGSPQRALALYELLAPHTDVNLWSEYAIEPSLARRYPIRQISLSRLQFPRSGTFIIVGVYFRIGRWYYLSYPRRVILINNIPRSHSFTQRMRKLTVRGLRQVEIVFASQQLREQFRHKGIVEYSPVNLERFKPPRKQPKSRPFTIGRHSRDTPEKHHRSDPDLYQRLALESCRIRILGGQSISASLTGNPAIELLPFGAEDAVDFLQTLDAFYYRTADTWIEPFGRVVVEAMACGLPVVCGWRGGYAELIDHAKDGFLVHSDDEAMHYLMALKHDPSWRREIGQAARKKVESVYSVDRLQSLRDYYLL